jgi:integrase
MAGAVRARPPSLAISISRRGAGEGSVYQRADGRWCAVIDLGRDIRGKRQRRVVYGRTRREVQRKAEEARLEHLQALSRAPRRELLGPFLDRWFQTLKPRPAGRYSPTTLVGYANVIERHLKPQLGHIRLVDLNADHIQRLQDRMLKAGYASQTALNARNILRGAIKYAQRQRLLLYNPAELVEPPQASRGIGRTMEPAAARRFLDAIRGHRLEAAFLMELALGLRRSEVLGLHWEDVDLQPGSEQLRVRKGLHKVNGQGFMLLEPKSERSKRTLALPKRLVALLERRRRDQLDERRCAGPRWQEWGLVFTSADPPHGRRPATVGGPINPADFGRSLKARLVEAGVGEFRGHDLRHWAASILQALGLPPQAAMDALGHASPQVTMGIYGHLLDASRRQAAALMDGFLDELDAGQVADA